MTKELARVRCDVVVVINPRLTEPLSACVSFLEDSRRVTRSVHTVGFIVFTVKSLRLPGSR